MLFGTALLELMGPAVFPRIRPFVHGPALVVGVAGTMVGGSLATQSDPMAPDEPVSYWIDFCETHTSQDGPFEFTVNNGSQR